MDVSQLDKYRWQIARDTSSGMHVPGIVYSDEILMRKVLQDKSLQQVANAATLPGIVEASLAMPDIHYGYGLPIGGVVATRVSDGVVTPGGVGFDINCGVRLLTTQLEAPAIKKQISNLLQSLYNNIPCGVGSRGRLKLSRKELRRVLQKGSRWAIQNGYGLAEELDRTEEKGAFEETDPDLVSPKAMDRGSQQLGTLGSGNHFAEIQVVDTIYEKNIATAFGLHEGQITVMIHSGSRGLGHQVCTDFLSVMGTATKKYGIKIPDRQLACAPLSSVEGKQYLLAMRCAANYAWANRQIMAHWARETFMKILGLSPRDLGMISLYDVAHNIVKIETFTIKGKKQKLAVHRKGATRAYPAHHNAVGEYFKAHGQPVIIPGDMGTHSFVLVGTEKALEQTFGSTCHGAGRVLSRKAAIKKAKGRIIQQELEQKGIMVLAKGRQTLAEEMPEAYKDISRVVDVVHNCGLSKKVARLTPLGVIKG
ncbi:RtcB family protein [candidate division CSSED10-310 bacterium]|uniref:tRNA-splicing ligase RtcB n=1 Tax=candidate division CSSED10-310 bacterium TaxID=2855610 RepID=A0ABV6Z4V0_UNCC1